MNAKELIKQLEALVRANGDLVVHKEYEDAGYKEDFDEEIYKVSVKVFDKDYKGDDVKRIIIR